MNSILSTLFHIANASGGFHGYAFRLLSDAIARFQNQLCILMGMSGSVERGRVCEAAGRVVVGLSRDACRVFP